MSQRRYVGSCTINKQQAEGKLRNDWEIGRLLAAYIASPYSQKKINNPKDLFQFDWDEDAGPKVGSDEWKEQAAEIRRRILAKEAEANG